MACVGYNHNASEMLKMSFWMVTNVAWEGESSEIQRSHLKD